MNKPAFDPNQPFQVADKPPFDPSKPFEPSTDSPPSTIGEVMNLVKTAGTVADRYKSSPAYTTSPPGLLEAGYQGAQKLFNKAGEKEAEYLAGQTTLDPSIMGKKLLKKPLTLTNPKPVNPLVAAAAGTATQMIPDITTAVASPVEQPQTLERSAQDQGMKAFGATKRFLNRAPKVDKMRESTQILMDAGVMKPFSSAEDLIDATNDVHTEAGKRIGGFLKSMTEKGRFLDKNGAIQELESLRPVGDSGEVLETGWYKDVNERINKAIDTLSAHKGDKMSFETANQVKTTLQSVVDFTKKAQSPVDMADRIIAGKFRDFIDRSLEGVSTIGKELSSSKAAAEFQQFLKDKKLYGAASTMMDPLYNRLSSEMGNKAVSITDWISAAGALGAGNPLAAAGIVGAKRAGERYGSQIGATALNRAAKMGIPAPPKFGTVGLMTRAPLLKKGATALSNAFSGTQNGER